MRESGSPSAAKERAETKRRSWLTRKVCGFFGHGYPTSDLLNGWGEYVTRCATCGAYLYTSRLVTPETTSRDSVAADRLPDPGIPGFRCAECWGESGEHLANCSRFYDPAPVSAAVSPAEPPRRRITVTHTRSLTFVQAEVDAVWDSGVLPIPDYVLVGDEATDPDERAIAVFTALDGSLLELFLERQDDDVSHEVEDYDQKPEPSVSPADTPGELAETLRTAFGEAVRWAGIRDKERCEATFPIFDAALAVLLAVGERDRRQIAQLTEALAQWEKAARITASSVEAESITASYYRGRAAAFREIAAVLADKEDAGMSAESICEKCGHDEVEHRADVLPFAVCRHVEYTDLPRSQVAVFSGVARACPCVSFVRAAGEGDT